MNRYTKMYGWLYNTFENTTFTIDDFRMTFPSSQPAKIIHDLIKLDFMKRVRRGEYQVVKPEEFFKKIVEENISRENVLTNVKRKYVFCDSTAVNIWTDGYYWTDFTKGFKPIHIQILEKDVEYWKKKFKTHGAEYVFPDENKTLFGVTYVVHPVESIDVEIKNGEYVVTLKEIIDFCKRNIFLYRPALEYLDKKYDLNLFTNHEQVAS